MSEGINIMLPLRFYEQQKEVLNGVGVDVDSTSIIIDHLKGTKKPYVEIHLLTLGEMGILPKGEKRMDKDLVLAMGMIRGLHPLPMHLFVPTIVAWIKHRHALDLTGHPIKDRVIVPMVQEKPADDGGGPYLMEYLPVNPPHWEKPVISWRTMPHIEENELCAWGPAPEKS